MAKILVTLGTTKFCELIEKVNYIKKYKITFQIADGEYIPKNHKSFRFTEKILDYYEKSDIIITHAGAGSIYSLLEKNKKIIIVPNLIRKDKHQLEIAEYIEKNNYGIVCYDINKIEDCIEKILDRNTTINEYKKESFTGKEEILEMIYSGDFKSDVKEKIVLIYGNGGHFEQMKRIFKMINCDAVNEKIDFLEISDTNCGIVNAKNIKVREFRRKYEGKFEVINIFLNIFIMFFLTLDLIAKNKIKLIISTGPGIAIIPSIIFKLFNIRIIHIESWSRFHNKSITGILLYYIADLFIIQNKELKNLYPKAKYKGRL